MQPSVIRGFLIVATLLLVVLGLRLAARKASEASLTGMVKAVSDGNAGGIIWEDCPRCRTNNKIRVGYDVRCSGCQVPLAACGQCGELLVGGAGHRDQSGTIWLCETHHKSEGWESVQVADLKQPDSFAPSPGSKRAVSARFLYDIRIAKAVKANNDVRETVFPYAKALSKKQLETLPPTVRGANQFHVRTVLEGDWGSPSVYQWKMDNKPLYVVLCTTDGSDGWVELYHGDGAALGHAHTNDYAATWGSKGKARLKVFGDSSELER